jgi:hypothetical protein
MTVIPFDLAGEGAALCATYLAETLPGPSTEDRSDVYDLDREQCFYFQIAGTIVRRQLSG